MWQPTLEETLQLYQRHAKHLEATHWGQYLALASDGRFIVGDDDVAVFLEAVQRLGEGNFVLLRVGEMDVLRQVSGSVVSGHYPYGAEFLLGRRILDRYRVTFDRGRQLVVERL